MDSSFLRILAVVIMVAALRQVMKVAYKMAASNGSKTEGVLFTLFIGAATVWAAWFLGLRI